MRLRRHDHLADLVEAGNRPPHEIDSLLLEKSRRTKALAPRPDGLFVWLAITQERHQKIGHAIGVEGVAFPNDQHLPSALPKQPGISPVSRDIFGELFGPEMRSRLRSGRSRATAVTMPEASVHENHSLQRGENHIGRTWQVAPMQSKSVTQPMRDLPNHHFRARVLRSNPGHEGGSGRRYRLERARSPRGSLSRFLFGNHGLHTGCLPKVRLLAESFFRRFATPRGILREAKGRLPRRA